MSKYKSWAITISTTEPVQGEIQEVAIKWLSQFDNVFAVIEGGPGSSEPEKERHLHAQIWTDTPKDKASLVNFWRRKFDAPWGKIHVPESQLYYAVSKGIRIAYDCNFLDVYMSKQIDAEILLDKVPDDMEKYYPSKEEQEKVQARANAADPKFYQWELDFLKWNENQEPIKFEQNIKFKLRINDFLNYKMFIEKKYKVISEKRKKIEACQNLYLYVLGKSSREFLTNDNIEELFKLYKKENPDKFDPE